MRAEWVAAGSGPQLNSAGQPGWLGAKGSGVQIPAPRPTYLLTPIVNSFQATWPPVGAVFGGRGNVVGTGGAKRLEGWLATLEVARMSSVKPALSVVGGIPTVSKSPLQAAYEHFRFDRMSNRASANTLEHYDSMIRLCLTWAADEGA